MADSRPIRLPVPDFDAKPLPVCEIDGLEALRIHGRGYPAIQFRQIPAHRFSHPDAPGGTMYLGFDLETCLWECFGDSVFHPGSVIRRDRWMSRRVSRISTPVTLRVCDLTNLRTRAVLKVDQSALQHTDLEIPQAWGLAIHRHPEKVDGLCYLSRFTTRRCLVLFDRPGLETKLTHLETGVLCDLDEADRFLDENRIALV